MHNFNVNTRAGRAIFLAYELHAHYRISTVERDAMCDPLWELAKQEASALSEVMAAQGESACATRQ